jgi:gliding motility-associated-like protein
MPPEVITFTIGDITGDIGDVVCIPITVDDFEGVVSIQFSFNFDPSVLQYTGFLDPNNLIGLSAGNLNPNNTNGYINFVWIDPNVGTTGGVTLPDGEEIFSLCFEIIGEPNDDANLTISHTPLDKEITQTMDGMDFTTDICVLIQGETNINCGPYAVFHTACSTMAGDDMGQISFYTCGGTAPYDYVVGPNMGTINNDGDTVIISNLPPGIYTIEITDNTGAMISSGNITIADAPALAIDLSANAPDCFGDDNGSATVLGVTGGVPKPGANPYCLSWSTSQYNVNTISNLVAGTYFVTATDDNGCSATASIDMNVQPLNLDIAIISNTTCVGNSDGVVEATAMGGTPDNNGEYEYRWATVPQFFDNDLVSTHSNVRVGSWTVRVIDDNGCTAEETFDMTPAKELDMSVVPTQVSCFGLEDGTAAIQALAIGPESTPYSFLVRHEDGTFAFGPIDPTTNTCMKSDLKAGIYNVTIVDNDGCELIDLFEITEPPVLTIDVDAMLDCSNPNDGGITIEGMGGTPDYDYLWESGEMVNELTNIPAGQYEVTVTDANGCSDSVMIDLTVSGSLVIDSFTVVPLQCGGDDNASITVHVTSSDPNLTYDWGPDGMGQTISNLNAGEYIVNVFDQTGCFSIDTINIVEPPELILDLIPTPPTCPGGNNGEVSAQTMGGTSPLSYQWNQGPDPGFPVLAGLTAGIYSVTVTDANNCSKEGQVQLDDPPIIIVDISNIAGVACFEEIPGDGTATATASGGVNPPEYNYIWSSGETGTGVDHIASTLASGQQWVIATDAICASDTFFFNVGTPDKIQLDLGNSILNDPACFGDCNGDALLVSTGGNPNYTYFWPGSGNTGQMESSLCAGIQYVEITDANGCTVLDSITLFEPTELVADVDPATTSDLNCFDVANGEIGIVHLGGNQGPFTYNWTNNVSTGIIATGLAEGNYEVTVTDTKGCTATTNYTVVQPPPIVANIPSPPIPPCFGEQTCITVTGAVGGAGPTYRFTVNNGPQFDLDTCVNVFAGIYTITVFDKDGCSYDTTLTINQPPELTVNLGADITLNLGDSSTILQTNITSDFAIDSIFWFPNESIECLDPLCEVVNVFPATGTNYTVTVIDENGCIAVDEVFVNVDENRNVYIPNAFTPNGDGFNDEFKLFTGDGVSSINYFRIFNRWGNVVFEAENLIAAESGTDGWDGKYRGIQAPPAVYTYIAEVNFIDGRKLIYRGGVTLLR